MEGKNLPSSERKRRQTQSDRLRLKLLKKELLRRREYERRNTSIDRSRNKSVLSRSAANIQKTQILLHSNILLAKAHARVKMECSQQKRHINKLTSELMDLKVAYNHLLLGDIEQEVQKRLELEKREYIRLLGISWTKMTEGVEILTELKDFMSGDGSRASSTKRKTSTSSARISAMRQSGYGHEQGFIRFARPVLRKCFHRIKQNRAVYPIIEEEQNENFADTTIRPLNFLNSATGSRNLFNLSFIVESDSILDTSVLDEGRSEETAKTNMLESFPTLLPLLDSNVEQLTFEKNPRRQTFMVLPSKQTVPLSSPFRQRARSSSELSATALSSESSLRDPTKSPQPSTSSELNLPTPRLEQLDVHNNTRRQTYVVFESRQTAPLSPRFRQRIFRSPELPATDLPSNNLHDKTVLTPIDMEISDGFSFVAPLEVVQAKEMAKLDETLKPRPDSYSSGSGTPIVEKTIIEDTAHSCHSGNNIVVAVEVDSIMKNAPVETGAITSVANQPIPEAEVSVVSETNVDGAAPKNLQEILNCSENAQLNDCLACLTEEESDSAKASVDKCTQPPKEAMMLDFSNIFQIATNQQQEIAVPSTSTAKVLPTGAKRKTSRKVSKISRKSVAQSRSPSFEGNFIREIRILSPFNRSFRSTISPKPVSPELKLKPNTKPKAEKIRRTVKYQDKEGDQNKPESCEILPATEKLESDVATYAKRRRGVASYKEPSINKKMRRC